MTATEPSPPVRAVVFDIGGVLLDWDPRHLYRSLIADERERERFLAEVCTMGWHAAHDLGVPFAQSAAALIRRHPEHAELIRAWGARSEEMVAGEIEGTVAILRELIGGGVPCYALTNMERETYALRVRRHGFMRMFAGTVVSSHEGVMKPDRAIFDRLVDRFGLDVGATLFVDDAAANVAAAAALGFRAVRFTTPARLRATLVELGILR